MNFEEYRVEVEKAIKKWCDALREKNRIQSASKAAELDANIANVKEDAEAFITEWKRVFPKKVSTIKMYVNEMLVKHLP